jgi:hypothetical protein
MVKQLQSRTISDDLLIFPLIATSWGLRVAAQQRQNVASPVQNTI